MGLFSFFRKNKQESASDQGEFRSRSAEETSALRSRSSRASNTSGRAPGGRGKAAKEAADPLLPEKKRARRRLIGAVALALAVVIALPMILDSEPKSLNDDIAIQIPSKDQPAANAAASAAQPAADKLASAASTLDQKEEIVEPAAVSPAPAATPAPTPTPVPVPAVVAPVTPPKPAEKPAAKPEEKKPAAAERKEEPKKEAPKKDTPKPKAAEQSDDSRALAILEGKSTAAADKKPAASGGKFVIQVAALATQDKINELRSKLSGAGIHSFTQKIATQSGDRTRIRVGPFASRDEAEKMGARIKKLGLNATIVPA